MKKSQKLPLEFYQRDTTQVARELLGKEFFCKNAGITTSGIIVETEAYLGIDDPACHTYKGRKTTRVSSMYKMGGYSYVYLIYGMHFCFNVVTQDESKPEAVLIRALIPQKGLDVMQTRRKLKPQAPLKNYCSGPGKLCQALGIDKSFDGLLLKGPELWIAESIPFHDIESKIEASPRIGVDYAREAKDWPLRFTVAVTS